jgi:hypothetical protein
MMPFISILEIRILLSKIESFKNTTIRKAEFILYGLTDNGYKSNFYWMYSSITQMAIKKKSPLF